MWCRRGHGQKENAHPYPLYQNIDIIRRHAPEYVVVLGGDHIYTMDYSKMLYDHVSSGADLTVGCIEASLEEATDFGVMSVDENYRITKFTEKPENPEPMPGKPVAVGNRLVTDDPYYPVGLDAQEDLANQVQERIDRARKNQKFSGADFIVDNSGGLDSAINQCLNYLQRVIKTTTK